MNAKVKYDVYDGPEKRSNAKVKYDVYDGPQ